MNYVEITSRGNEKIKYVSRLVRSARERNKSSLFVCEGLRLCFDAAESGFKIKEAYFTREALSKYENKARSIADSAEKVYTVTDEAAKRLSDTVNSQGVFCVVEMKERRAGHIRYNNIYTALENVQNPQNLGATARTAEALGIDGIIAFSGCDRYNPKALRASMGSLLRMEIIETDDLAAILRDAGENGMLTFATMPDGGEDIKELSFRDGAIAVIGNEGNGVSDEVKKSVKKLVTIKMKGNTESLNASAAAVITMWEMMK